MAVGIMFAVAPLLIFMMIVVLPAGRPALTGIAITGVIVTLIWAGYPFAAGPLWTGDSRADVFMLAAALIYTVAWVAGALAQTLGRWLILRTGALSYSLLATLILLLTFGPLLFTLGI